MRRQRMVLGLSLILGLAACSRQPVAISPSPQDDGRAGFEIQQRPRTWYGWADPYRPRTRPNLERIHRICGDVYRDCIAQDQRANPGAPGSLFGGTPQGQAACERAMNACYRRFGVRPTN